MAKLSEVKKYKTFEEYCDNIYCCNKNPWSNIDEDCQKCKSDYYNKRKKLANKEEPMREILFRGKRVNSGDWVQGDLRQVDAETYILDYDIGDDGISQKLRIFDIDYHVDPATIGQFTGLTDKNGKRIFEGDIVTGRFSKENVRGHIVYGSDATFFIDRGGLHGIGLDNSEDWLEVIGNIHDNHELLK